MNITFITNQSLTSPSGLGRHWPLAKGLAGLGHAVKIICLHHNLDDASMRRYSIDGVEIDYAGQMHVKKVKNDKLRLSKPQLLKVLVSSSCGIFRRALKTKTDLLYLCKPQPINSPAALAAKWIRRLPLVVDCDDYEAFSGNFSNAAERLSFRFFEDKVPQYSDLVTVNTFFQKNRYIQLGVPEEKILYLPNGVDPERFVADRDLIEELREKYQTSRKQVVLYFGSIDLKSGHPVDLLVRSFRRVVQSRPDCILLIVGGGIDLKYLKNLAVDEGIYDAIHFTGWIDPAAIPAFIELSDLCVDPATDSLGCIARCPLKLFEAMYMGVPNLTAGVGDRGYLLGEGRYGYLVEPNSEEALAAGILDALADAEQRKRIAAAGREHIKQFYWENLARKYHDFITVKLNINNP